MRFYIASSFSNIENVRHVAEQLKLQGLIQTYDWTLNSRAASLLELREIGQKEKDAVFEADIFILMIPGGKGAHIELGIAIGSRKKIILYSPTGEINNFETTSTFYHLPEVYQCIGTLDDLLCMVTEMKWGS